MNAVCVTGASDDVASTLEHALALYEARRYESALPLLRSIEHRVAPPGVDVHLFICLLKTGRFDELLPYLESTLGVPGNERNPELWRMAGLLQLKYRNSVGEACRAWQTAIALDPAMLDRYPGLSIAGTYETMALAGMEPVVHYVDLATGEFSVEFVRPVPMGALAG